MNYELSDMCQSDIKVLPLLRFLAKQPTWQSFCRQNQWHPVSPVCLLALFYQV